MVEGEKTDVWMKQSTLSFSVVHPDAIICASCIKRRTKFGKAWAFFVFT